MTIEWKKTKYVVRDNRELGYMYTEMCPLDPLSYMIVISSSILKGSLQRFGDMAGTCGHKIRGATREDFEVFRVQLPSNYILHTKG